MIRLVGVTIREESVAEAMSKGAKFQHGETYKNVRSMVTKLSGPYERGGPKPNPTELAETISRAKQQWTEQGYAELIKDMGMLLFCGSLYGIALAGLKWLGPLTPLGGLTFILGWGIFGWRVWKGVSTP